MTGMTEPIPSIAACKFYHAMDLPQIGFVQGGWDLRGRFDDYIGGVDLRDRSVLDVGTASGFLSFEAERRGARSVTSFTAASSSQLQRNPGLEANQADFEALLNSYRLAHHLLKSNAIPIFGDIYRLGDFAPKSDVVIVGQILVHLRDPFGALLQIAKCAADTLIIVEGMFDHPDPIAAYLGGTAPIAWFHFSTKVYRQFLPKLGFEIISITPGKYRCVSLDKDEAVWTLVARRR
jgi:SAM-dependent methyltransferase